MKTVLWHNVGRFYSSILHITEVYWLPVGYPWRHNKRPPSWITLLFTTFTPPLNSYEDRKPVSPVHHYLQPVSLAVKKAGRKSVCNRNISKNIFHGDHGHFLHKNKESRKGRGPTKGDLSFLQTSSSLVFIAYLWGSR